MQVIGHVVVNSKPYESVIYQPMSRVIYCAVNHMRCFAAVYTLTAAKRYDDQDAVSMHHT